MAFTNSAASVMECPSMRRGAKQALLIYTVVPSPKHGLSLTAGAM